MPLEPRIDDYPDDSLFDEIRYDDAVFQVIFKKYFTILCTYCQHHYSFDLELAKEAVHTSFIKLWENRKTLDSDLSVKAYLYSIVRNSCLDVIRHQMVKRKYEKYIQQHFSESDFEHDLNFADTKLLKDTIDHAVSTLPPKMRKIFELSRYQGLKYAQIAKELDISVKTVETQMSRALQKLRAKLSGFFTLLWFVLLLQYLF
jgi:RNA polymerase sigma-70 factor (ECF subfamily)